MHANQFQWAWPLRFLRFGSFEKWPKFPFRSWTIVHGLQSMQSIIKVLLLVKVCIEVRLHKLPSPTIITCCCLLVIKQVVTRFEVFQGTQAWLGLGGELHSCSLAIFLSKCISNIIIASYNYVLNNFRQMMHIMPVSITCL